MADTGQTADLGLYVPRSLLESVPEERRPEYLRAVEEFAGRKYQIAVEVAKQLPALLAGPDPEAADRYLAGVRAVADADWRAGVEAARYLQHLQASGDPVLAQGYADVVAQAVASSSDDGEHHSDEAELERLERQLGGEVAGAVLALAATPTLAELLVAHHFSAEGLAEWVGRGLRVLERNADIGRAYFRMATKQALADLEELREGLRLRQVARVLKLYATALSGRDVMIRAADELAGLDIMTFDHIALPAEMGAFDEEEDNFRAYKVATAHGAGRIEFGTYRFRLQDIPETVSALEGRYPTE